MDRVVALIITQWMYLLGLGLLGASYWFWNRFRAKDFCREKLYNISFPFPLTGAPDLVRQEDGGLLTIHDLKNRAKAVWFESDRIQLSLYKLLIERATGRKVSEKGYIRVRTNGKADQLLSVPLYTEKQMIALYDRYMSFQAGQEQPRFCKSMALCKLCGFYKSKCFPPEPSPSEMKTKKIIPIKSSKVK